MHYANSMRQKMHIVQVMCNYDPNQELFFLYSTSCFFSKDTLATHYYTVMGVEETDDFIKELVELSTELVNLPKVLIVFVNFCMAMREYPNFTNILYSFLSKLEENNSNNNSSDEENENVASSSKNTGQQPPPKMSKKDNGLPSKEELCWVLQMATELMSNLIRQYGQENLISRLSRFIDKAYNYQLFFLSDVGQSQHLK